MTAGPRSRLIASTIAVVQEQGVHAAGLAELLKRSNASRNSLYQHFPAGKSELVENAAKIVSRIVNSHIARADQTLESTGDLGQWLDFLISFWRGPLESSAYREGSFMMAAALAESDPNVQAVAGQAFVEWSAQISKSLTRAGFSDEAARSLGGFTLTVIEGAIIQSRALKSVHPLDEAHQHLIALLRHYLAEPTG
ncbi:TetR/AcrR family transcriptional regulator [Nocardia jejuensis]|uniref:TetR/AcrR family transcriptional regulator n=1 Tax=Nocardia jejuensis TaxID=328049 RepID=UPI00082EB507|nr:TetR/AcrR family transcriptional regulator [Nocardia jejuensis]